MYLPIFQGDSAFYKMKMIAFLPILAAIAVSSVMAYPETPQELLVEGVGHVLRGSVKLPSMVQASFLNGNGSVLYDEFCSLFGTKHEALRGSSLEDIAQNLLSGNITAFNLTELLHPNMTDVKVKIEGLVEDITASMHQLGLLNMSLPLNITFPSNHSDWLSSLEQTFIPFINELQFVPKLAPLDELQIIHNLSVFNPRTLVPANNVSVFNPRTLVPANALPTVQNQIQTLGSAVESSARQVAVLPQQVEVQLMALRNRIGDILPAEYLQPLRKHLEEISHNIPEGVFDIGHMNFSTLYGEMEALMKGVQGLQSAVDFNTELNAIANKLEGLYNTLWVVDDQGFQKRLQAQLEEVFKNVEPDLLRFCKKNETTEESDPEPEIP